MNEQKIRGHLRRWDPAADAEPPSAELRARIRARLIATARADRPPSKRAWLVGRWAVPALAATGILLLALTLARLEGSRFRRDLAVAIEPTAPPAPDVQVVYTASNGVRIYWSVPAAEPSSM